MTIQEAIHRVKEGCQALFSLARSRLNLLLEKLARVGEELKKFGIHFTWLMAADTVEMSQQHATQGFMW